MRMLRLKRFVPTRSSAVHRPLGSDRGTLTRMTFGPGAHSFRADRRTRWLRLSNSRAIARWLIRARATTVRPLTVIRNNET